MQKTPKFKSQLCNLIKDKNNTKTCLNCVFNSENIELQIIEI